MRTLNWLDMAILIGAVTCLLSVACNAFKDRKDALDGYFTHYKELHGPASPIFDAYNRQSITEILREDWNAKPVTPALLPDIQKISRSDLTALRQKQLESVELVDERNVTEELFKHALCNKSALFDAEETVANINRMVNNSEEERFAAIAKVEATEKPLARQRES